MSQFSKKYTIIDPDELSEDATSFAVLEEGSEDDEEEPITEEGQDDDNANDNIIDPAVAKHDAVLVDELIDELNLQTEDARFLSSLTCKQINLGRFSLAKVRTLSCTDNSSNGVFNSSLTSENECSTVQHYERISKFVATEVRPS